MNGIRITMAALLLTALNLPAQDIQVNRDNKTIAVTATDRATANPDVAVIDIGFQTFAPDASTAYAEGSKISNTILGRLSAAGVPDKAVQSNAQSLQRMEFDDNNKLTPQERQQRQFSLSQSWTVKTEAKTAAGVLNIAIQAGANQSGNINWDLADRNALEGKAAENALVRARSIAEHMAKGLNARLTGLVYASNQVPYRGVPLGGNYEFASSASVIGKPPTTVAPLGIRPHEVEESATVYAVFAIE